VLARKTIGVVDMSSRGPGADVKADAKHSLRIGVIGAGVMGSNHARVLAGLPDITPGRRRTKRA
jgi:hypothetical protein